MKFIGHHGLTESEAVAWSLAFVVMGTLVMVINTLTLLTFTKTSTLRTRRHVMIINLTAADLLFGAVGMSSTVFYLLKPSYISLCLFHILNRYPKMASLYTIGVIAVERMHAIVFPLRHRVLSNIVYKIAVVFIWSIAAVTTTTTVLFATGIWEHALLSSGLHITVALSVVFTTVCCYVAIWISFRRRKRHKLGVLSNQDKTLAVTLLFVAGGFIITWFPPSLYFSVARVCKSCVKANETTVGFGVVLLLGVQSLINPIIYCFRLSGFKVSLKALLKRMVCFVMCRPSRAVQSRKSTIHPEIQVAS